MNNKLEKLFHKLKSVRLRPDEKAALRERILASARGLVPTYEETSHRTFWSVVFSQRALVSVPVAVLVLVGVTYGAENALPGQALYPLKVGLNEPVLHLLSLSQTSQVNFEAKMAERRLSEAVLLIEKGLADKKMTDSLLDAASVRMDNFVYKTENLNKKSNRRGENVSDIAILLAPNTESNASGDATFMLMAVSETEYESEEDGKASKSSSTETPRSFSRAGLAEQDFSDDVENGEGVMVRTMMVENTSASTTEAMTPDREEDDGVRSALNRVGEKIEKAKANLKRSKQNQSEEDRQEAIREASEARFEIENLRGKIKDRDYRKDSDDD